MARVRDLKDQTGIPDNDPGREVFLYCPACGERNSANAGDYWDWPPDHEFVCPACQEPMILARQETKIIPA